MKKIIAANWKMNLGPREATAYSQEFLKLLQGDTAKAWAPKLDWVLFAPSISLESVQRSLNGSLVRWGAQNFYPQPAGAFTGEISADMLKEVGTTHVLVGHSERRRIFHESNILWSEKVKRALEVGLTPMLCVGETQEEREQNKTRDVVATQLKAALFASKALLEHSPIQIAYEPVWAIGTGRVATVQQAQEVHSVIRQWLASELGQALACRTPVLYGGSVKPENAQSFKKAQDIDGFLVGGASLDAKSFAQIGFATI